MTADTLENVKKILLMTIPFFWVVILLFVTCIPLGMAHFSFVTPQIPLIAVFYFSVYKSDCFNLLSAFFCGLIADVVLMMPFGINALAYASMFFIADKLRRFIAGKHFYITWIEFALFAVLTVILQSLLLSFWYQHFIPFTPVIISLALLISLYPLIACTCYFWAKIVAEKQK